MSQTFLLEVTIPDDVQTPGIEERVSRLLYYDYGVHYAEVEVWDVAEFAAEHRDLLRPRP